MSYIKALSLAPDVNDWLTKSQHPRILHVFDPACNLINERGDVLSIVTQQIGNGPFNLVIEDDIFFSEHLHVQSSISIRGTQLQLGDLTIDTADAHLWSPLPNWETLHAQRDDILTRLRSFPIPDFQFPNSLPSSLSSADLASSIAAARQLAGLGIGLTPAGDDFILGAILATWIVHPFDVAKVFAEEIANTAAPLTTSLSAAWLKSAGKGEAGILWHEFFDALIAGDAVGIQSQIDKLLSLGETSGADALSGFLGTFVCWGEMSGFNIS